MSFVFNELKLWKYVWNVWNVWKSVLIIVTHTTSSSSTSINATSIWTVQKGVNLPNCFPYNIAWLLINFVYVYRRHTGRYSRKNILGEAIWSVMDLQPWSGLRLERLLKSRLGFELRIFQLLGTSISNHWYCAILSPVSECLNFQKAGITPIVFLIHDDDVNLMDGCICMEAKPILIISIILCSVLMTTRFGFIFTIMFPTREG